MKRALLTFVITLWSYSVSAAGYHAILAGVADYPSGSGYADLPLVENDLSEMSSLLTSLGWDVTLLADIDGADGAPTYDNIEDALDANWENEDFVIFYFSGHGKSADGIAVLDGMGDV